MLIYEDIVSGNEMCTDAYKMELKDDCFYYVAGESKQYKSEDIDDSAIGGNKSAEAEDDGGDRDTTTKFEINVVHDNRLVEVFFADKKDYAKRNLKPFLAAIKKRKIAAGELKDEEAALKAWEATMMASVKKHILSKFDDLQFFVGESEAEDGHVACCYYDDAGKPWLLFFRDGLKEVKC